MVKNGADCNKWQKMEINGQNGRKMEGMEKKWTEW